MTLFQPCPCQSGKPYKECCEPFHLGALPSTAELLMRARYTAYAMGLTDYIIKTTHPDLAKLQRPEWRKDIEHFSNAMEFLGVTIRSSQEEGAHATVTFTARLKADGEETSFTERSTFEKVDGKWLYKQGKIIA